TFNITINKLHKLHNAIEDGPRNGRDVTDGEVTGQPDGQITAADVLAVINFINSKGAGPIQGSPTAPPYVDVNADNEVTAEDAVIVINYINSHPGQSEASSLAANATTF